MSKAEAGCWDWHCATIAGLSALGIAIGVAAIVAVLGLAASSQAALLAEISRLGTNLLTVTNGQTFSGATAELPVAAPGMITRLPGVTAVQDTGTVGGVSVYKSPYVPAIETNGLSVDAATLGLPAVVGTSLAQGRFLDAATAREPVAVLGAAAARLMGIDRIRPGMRIWVGAQVGSGAGRVAAGQAGGQWFYVTGILGPAAYAPQIDSAVLVGFPAAAEYLHFDGHPSDIYVRTADTQAAVTAVDNLLGAQASPENPSQVDVSRPSDALTARADAKGALDTLFLGLGAVALLVGAIGVANIMVTSVLERRSEIGLRRALGATRGQVRAQFLAEAILLSLAGGVAGVAIGAAATAAYAHGHGEAVGHPVAGLGGRPGRRRRHWRPGRPAARRPRRPPVTHPGPVEHLTGTELRGADTYCVPGYEQTNVRLPLCALNALAVVMDRRGISRDEAVRQVLGEHVERQENREPEDRLTHISTILRYPAPPRWRGDPRTDRPLRLRLAPGMIARARAVSLRLPGQSPRAHHDYQARLLTDAMMTAIAVQKPFSDEFLAGLLPLLRHGAALRLWQLAVAVTSTPAEDAIRDAAEEARSPFGRPDPAPSAEEDAARYRVQLVDDALDEEVAWHSPGRFQAAANLARDMLSGASASANEQLLYEQKAEWNELRLDLRSHGTKRDSYRRGTTDLNWSGRGGAAVWRAQRKVELQDLGDWLVDVAGADPASRPVDPPGWRVRLPGTWRARIAAAAATGLAEPYATWVAAGRLLAFPVGSKQAVWPLIGSPDRPGWTPVPGIESVLAAAAGLRSEQVVSFIEAVLVDWSAEYEYPDFALLLPADEAFGWGFIGEDERRDAVAQARAATLREMSDIIDWSPDDERAELEQARDDPHVFGRAAARLGINFIVAEAACVWPGRSVVDELLAGRRAGATRWLAGLAYDACTMQLQQSMEQAWHDAFDRHAAD